MSAGRVAKPGLWIVLGLCALAILTPQRAAAFPVVGNYVDTGGPNPCDDHGPMTLTEELGPAAVGFPVDEQIAVSVVSTTQVVTCNGTSGADWEVTMTNLSSNSYTDLFLLLGVGFYSTAFPKDGTVDNPNDATASLSFAFRIDSVGLNQPLLSESILADDVFAPNETWVFLLTNFTVSSVVFGSKGIVGHDVHPGSNASIVGRVAPPAPAFPDPLGLAVFVLALALVGLAIHRRSQTRE